MLMFRRFFPKSNIHQKNYNRQKRIMHKKRISYFSKINHLIESSLSFLARNKNRIASKNLLVNEYISSNVFSGLNTGSINTKRASVAARLIKSSERIANQVCEGLFNNSFIYLKYIT